MYCAHGQQKLGIGIYDFLPTAPQATPSTGSTELFPDNPLSTHQKFGPLTLDNWLPDSAAICHYTPIFGNLQDIQTCHIPFYLQMEPQRPQLSREPLIATSPLMKDKDLSLA
jgi:hypothetical protein